MNTIEKLMELSRLKNEMLRVVLPEKVMGHVEVINKEIKMMITELVCDVSKDKSNDHKSGVTKVEID